MGYLVLLRLIVYMCVRYVIAFSSKCFKCLMLISPGPVELLLLDCCIACFVSCSEIGTCVFCSFLIFLSMTLLLCIVDYFVALLNCFLKRWAFSAFVEALSVRCFFQSCCLCSFILLYILLFGGASCRSLGFCFRIVFCCI